jgi:hypothetical protein
MTWLHALTGIAAVIGSLSVPRGVAWFTALFGSDRYSQRAMHLLRRSPLPGAARDKVLPRGTKK